MFILHDILFTFISWFGTKESKKNELYLYSYCIEFLKIVAIVSFWNIVGIVWTKNNYHQYTRQNVEPPSWKLASSEPMTNYSRAANTFAAPLIIEVLRNCIFNQINGAFHNYLSLYIGDNDNNTTFVGSLFICGPCNNICTLAPLGRKRYYAGHK